MRILKTVLLASAAVVAFGSVASAADAIRPAPAPVVPVYDPGFDWSGFYAGLNGGYTWGQAYDSTGVLGAGTPTPLDQINGLIGGAQIGFNVQHDAIVFGIEADIQASGALQTVGPATFGVDYFGTVRARIGVDVGNDILPYLTAGVAYGGGRFDNGVTVEREFHTGWAVGGGVEFALDQQVSIKGEYLYTDLGERNYGGVVDAGFRGHTVRAGVNFHF